ncbi:MAG: bifunctional DNA primase/polymerase, partial [Candidatus Zapsychrus exili]|nr:bifunctional DNA primase/polymerase [Candidatus Zapsychrus exili]
MNKSFNRPVDGALYMFYKGYKVFPVKPGRKDPVLIGWQEWADTATEQLIIDTGTANPTYNWGIRLEENDIVIDLDKKKGKDGEASLQKLEATHGKLPVTFTVLTPTGGKHLYFKGRGSNTAGSVGEGIDTRSFGGFVVTPGSRIDDKVYEIEIEGDAADLPKTYSELIGKKKEVVVLNDTKKVEEGERNAVLTSLAGTLRRRGLNYDSIYLSLQAINEHQLEVPVEDEELKIIAGSIAKYKPEDAIAASDFLELPEIKAFTARSINLAAIPKRDWIMQNRYIGEFISLIIAPGGVGKSTLAMLDAVSIATGKPLSGFDITKQGAVWLYNMEDPRDELERRMAALSISHRLRLDDEIMDN